MVSIKNCNRSRRNKSILVMVFFASLFTGIKAQKFNAPASADTMHNPFKNAASAAMDGKKVYTQYCVVCHGEKGKGDGAAVAGLSKKPADHTSVAFQKQSDGAIYWKIANGNSPMPAFKATLKPKQIWQLVNYARTLAIVPK
jgi:mono/diheme cytochrome c family protein